MNEKSIVLDTALIENILEERKTQPIITVVTKKIEDHNIGDILWVKEKFQLSKGDFAPTLDEELTKTPSVVYYASDHPRYRDKDKWQPPWEMPRWASRMAMEVIDIGVETIQWTMRFKKEDLK
uniref:Uncharacterized protein n=1 Tax=viral metagenome TaxID=1070528 RepID=A0A6H1ZUZ5_9ZZZZ